MIKALILTLIVFLAAMAQIITAYLVLKTSRKRQREKEAESENEDQMKDEKITAAEE